ncbi:MAG TPA: tetratricopeptide repeat protein [Tepidisphaeraceae bacterium]|nr:tetratricopeptide repeat protein [Tepidisphaeraceae bacterium]
MTDQHLTPAEDETGGLRELIENQPRLAAWLGGALIVVLTLIAYKPAIVAGYIWDDDHHVTNNPLIRDWQGLGRIWTDVFPHPSEYQLPQYYPLTHTTFWIEYHLWGLNPIGYHTVNVVLHVANAMLVWLLLRKLAVPGAWLAAAIFALHPLNVESVAWVSERKNCLSLLFFLSSLYVYLRYAGVIVPTLADQSTTARWFTLPDDPQRLYALAATLFACALLSKTVANSMPAVALLLIWWKRGKLKWSDIQPALPLIAAGIVLGTLTAYMEQVRVGVALRPQLWKYAHSPMGEFGARCIIAGRVAWFYLGKLIVPFPLIFNYERWDINAADPMQYLWPLSVLVIVGLIALSRKLRGGLVAILFYLGTLVPAMGFIDLWPMQYSFVADHFVYFSTIGLIALISALIVKNLTLEGTAGVAACALLLFFGMTWSQGNKYESNEKLWYETLMQRDKTSWMAANNYGVELRDRGLIREAELWFNAALKLKPNYTEAYYNLGVVAEIRGLQAEQALAAATQPSTQNSATQPTTRPDDYYAQAAEDYVKAIEVDPNYGNARFRLALMLQRKGQPELAADELKRVVALSPRNAAAWQRLGYIFMQIQKPADAVDSFRHVLDLEPDSSQAHADVGAALLQVGDLFNGFAEWETALQLSPGNVAMANDFGKKMFLVGDYRRAEVFFRQALPMQDPPPVELLTNLAVVMAKLGQPDEARKLLTQALQLDPTYTMAKDRLADLAAGRIPPATTRASTAPSSQPMQ